MAWERTYNNPPVDSYHTVRVNKPAGWKKSSVTGRGLESDPWIITYVAVSGEPAESASPSDMSIRVFGKPYRDAWLRVVHGGTTHYDRPRVRDSYSGGPVPKPIVPKKSGSSSTSKSAKGAKKAVAKKKASKKSASKASGRKAGSAKKKKTS